MSSGLSPLNFEPKLSLLAQFDDLCRFSNYNISNNQELGAIKDLVENQEENRKEWLSTKQQFLELSKENKELKSTLSQMKRDLTKSNQKKEYFRTLSQDLRQRLDAIKEFVEKNVKICDCDPNKHKLYSYFEHNGEEESETDSEEYSSLDDQSLWDETDDIMEDLGRICNNIDINK